MMKTLLLVGVGGGAGSILRYLTSVALTKWTSGHYPWGTFVVNVTGCLLIGMLLAALERHEQPAVQNLRFLFVTGFCGGFTTFSAFASENIRLMQSGQIATALLYTGASVILSLLAVWLGLVLAK